MRFPNRRERQIRQTLAGLARQRVAIVGKQNGIWVIEMALQRQEHTEASLATCLLRGWVEPLHEDMPVGELDLENIPSSPAFTDTRTIYRLTDGGWAALNRAHAWTVTGILLTLISILLTIALAT